MASYIYYFHPNRSRFEQSGCIVTDDYFVCIPPDAKFQDINRSWLGKWIDTERCPTNAQTHVYVNIIR